MLKSEIRDEIDSLTREYLLAGGLIELIPKRNYVPKWRKWMLKYDWSYTPWTLLGADDEQIKRDMFESSVGEGCYMTTSSYFHGSEE